MDPDSIQRDWSDPAIRHMIWKYHRPRELWFYTKLGDRIFDRVACLECEGTWPCQATQALRSWQQQHLRGEDSMIR